MKSWNVAIQMKATEQYFPLVLFINTLYKVVLTNSLTAFVRTVKNSLGVRP